MKTLKEHIAEFEFDNKLLMEMAKVGEMDNKLVIYVRSNDAGNIPHFHIVDKQTLGDKFHTCIKIESPEYFHHEGKEDTLNSKQRKNLIEFFKKSDKWGDNYWKIVVQEWNRNNSDYDINPNTPIPDYTKL